jgi:glutaredoxin
MKHESKLRVFGFDECPYCLELKNKLKNNGIEFTYYDIDSENGEKEYNLILKHCESEYLPLIVVDYNILTADKSFSSIDEAYDLIVKLLKTK